MIKIQNSFKLVLFNQKYQILHVLTVMIVLFELKFEFIIDLVLKSRSSS